MVNGKIRVVIADDHPLIRNGLQTLLANAPGIEVVGEACNGKEAVALVYSLSPDVLVLDIQMPVMTGLDALDILYKQKSQVKVIILSAYDDPLFMREASDKGVCAYFLKDDAPFRLVNGIREAVNYRGGTQDSTPVL